VGRAQPKALAADFTNVLISIRRRSAGAKRQSPKASIDELSFRGRQLASTLANQYSLVFHVFLLSSFLSPLIGPKTFNKKIRGNQRRTMKRGAGKRATLFQLFQQ
jgi:hypothetical protein